MLSPICSRGKKSEKMKYVFNKNCHCKSTNQLVASMTLVMDDNGRPQN
jgi:hypothetical protein